jgi:UDP-N-acetylglucosamine--N-acetylmuramyl-(pentapeptide) pyrophosphoryl-undecaprenol N-acetylglucosamine transferase
MKQTPLKILMTGGHLTPCLAVIPKLQQLDCQVQFVGRQTTDHYGSISHEEEEIAKYHVPFVPLNAPKLHRKPLSKNLREITKIISCWQNANRIVSNFKPDVIMSFGGYVAFPVTLAGKMAGIPVITHEQTTRIGLANRLIRFYATKVASSWPSLDQLNRIDYSKPSNIDTKNVFTGNPVRSEFTKPQPVPSWLKINSGLPLLYITGGSQGSRAINHYVGDHLKELTGKYNLVHQTGSSRDSQDYRHLAEIKEHLPDHLRSRYFLQPWIQAAEVAYLLANADLVIGRAGANTLTEIVINQTKCILIPLPVSGNNEQLNNARLIATLGLARVLQQDDLNDLENLIAGYLAQPINLDRKILNKYRQLHNNAVNNLVELILCAGAKK